MLPDFGDKTSFYLNCSVDCDTMENVVFVIKKCVNSPSIKCASPSEINDFIDGISVFSYAIQYEQDYAIYDREPFKLVTKKVYKTSLFGNRILEALINVRNNVIATNDNLFIRGSIKFYNFLDISNVEI
jgi:hypothetical protein